MSDMASDRWLAVHILPNLELPRPEVQETDSWPLPWNGGLTLGSRDAAIVPPEDQRVLAICAGSRAAKAMIHGCRGVTGQASRASVLIVRSAAELSMEALIDFRNAIAFTHLLKARCHVVQSGNGSALCWSDIWDCHPAMVTTTDRLIVQTAALKEIFAENAKFAAMCSPLTGVSRDRLFADDYLAWALGRAWRQGCKRHRRRDSLFGRLLRSLEVAYHAAAVPAKHGGSVYEFGMQAALWISALEILAWRDREDKDVKMSDVLRLLGTNSRTLTGVDASRRRMRIGRRVISVAPIEQACILMYRARNAFLHGNWVTWRALTHTTRMGKVNLHQLAGVVYRAALRSYLQPRFSLNLDAGPWSAKHSFEFMALMDYEEALLTALGRRPSTEWM
jgi:hypothetical protein